VIDRQADTRLGRFQKLLCLHVFAAAFVMGTLGVGKAEEAETKSETKSEKSDAGVETEHIFGFTEGTDIGEKGEREIESTFVGSIGKIGRYANLSNETDLRYNATDRLRLSFGTLTDFYSIHNVPNLPNTTSAGFSGLDVDARFIILDRHSAPFGMDIGITPQWRRLDDVSGVNTQNFAIPMALLVDKDVIPDKLYTAANFTYTPSIARTSGVSQHEDLFESSVAAAGVVAPNILAGAELRHLALAENGTFISQALFAGPSLYAKFSENFEAKIAWSAQLTDFSKRGLALENFNRHQIIFLVAYTF
jgi:hypothetical protein